MKANRSSGFALSLVTHNREFAPCARRQFLRTAAVAQVQESWRNSPDLKEYPAESAMLIGTEGALLHGLGYPPQLLPQETFKDVKRPNLPPRNHYHHFVDAILGGEKNESHFAQTGPMTEAILLGTVAIRAPNQKLEWDHAQMRVKNLPEANGYLRRKYREGWHLAKF